MVSSVSGSTGRVTMPMRPPRPEDAFKQIDTTGKGYVTESDMASAIVKISPQGGQMSQADAAAQAKTTFSKMDSNQDGQVTPSEFKAGAPKRAAGMQPPGGPPPGGGPGGTGGPSGPGGARPSASSSSNQSYDPADSNQDGIVSATEQQSYAATAAVKAYQAVSRAS